MKESFYIDMERRKQVQEDWKSIDKVPPVSLDEKLNYSGFEPYNFPDRECKPIVRRRSRAEVLRLINMP